MRRVVVTGLGAVTPLALGVKHTWKHLLAGQCGIKKLGEKFNDLPVQIAATVPAGNKDDGGWNPKEWLVAGEERGMALFSQYSIAAAEEALQDAGWAPKTEEELERTGVCLGSGIGSLEDAYSSSIAYESGGLKKVSPRFVPRLLINLAAGHITMKHGFKGPNHSVSTACTSGAHSIGDASRFIQFGDADIMVAGGSESCIHPLAIAGFARARSLATDWNDNPTASSRPFDRARAGFVMGEGAGVLVLEEYEHAKKRGAKIYAELLGYGLSADAHHITAPPKDGAGAYLAMKRALVHAKKGPGEVQYVNAHATSTLLGDVAENSAICRLLGEDRRPHEINISSTKGAVGHLLGAAGAVEALFTVLAVHENVMPPTLNLDNPDEGFECNYVPNIPQQNKIDVAVSNSFGFGGTNASLCFAKLR
ncbi:ketoacyl synthase domain-containing protein [Pyronema domesticum]|uniref:3-oxoacyl-[acyl-carrier-protein] synthase n=1 Tax=Pyronema omphalodes (strain CBS 100304) TaxID=1076935 RepID=U4L877_PYROM|nr:ketoacyl synthase domain-containing protein [Pyronema domesticum]CCX06349.1 Similar to Putative 3-oxoacyl-[acyl-carrier-protein] synthase, mitochondrial; acc. no. O94297 [Pyronema omphalodes CBS 100304]